VERVEQLEQEHRDIRAGFRTHNPKELMVEQNRFFAKLEREERRPEAASDFSRVLDFPGMPNYKGPRQDKPVNVVLDPPRRRRPLS
jgi:hypothetical protein